ncbi:glycoside hydrolase family 25 protein [Anaerotignum lactatifermentans]|uniref:glycoside hydrolase family 25 protein n=1 Tax=Anaerotignum lactatifermentans TaxID=160404 RepID=UPI001FA8DD9A
MLKQMKKRIVEGIQLPDKKQQNQLRKDVEQALQESIKDLAEHGGGPKAEDRFWKRLEKIIADDPKNRILYLQYHDFHSFWQYTENWYSCYPPNLSEEERDKALGYAEFKRKNVEDRERYMTVYFPCGRIGLKGFFVDNKLPESCGHTVYGVYCENEKTYTIGEILEKLPNEEMDVFQLNELFCRFDKLPEDMQHVYDLTLQLKEPRNVKEMIDLMGHLPEVCVVNGIQNESQLGEFLVENELFDVSFTDEALPYLDYAKIARTHMKFNNGKIIKGIYVEDTSLDISNQTQSQNNEQDDDYEMKL